MTILTVGTGQQYQSLSAAVAASHDGDTIYVQAGTYVNDFPVIKTKISIVGVGGMAHLTATVAPPNGKAIITTSNDVTIDHIEVSGAKVRDNNGAGIRSQAGNLTVTNSYLHDNQNGLLTSNVAGAIITVDRTEFASNGFGDGLAHNMYIGAADLFVLTNSYTHDAIVGHEIKSKAKTNIIQNNRIFDNAGTSSYSIDLPFGGAGSIINNIIQQGPNSKNNGIIAFGEHAVSPANSHLSIAGNTIINDLNKVSAVLLKTAFATVLEGNHIFGLKSSQFSTSNAAQSGNDILSSAPALDQSHPWQQSPWDHLVSGGDDSDELTGSSERDLFVGGNGRDIFDIAAGGGSDTIADFMSGPGASDIVYIHGYGLGDFAAVRAAMIQSGNDVVLNLGRGDTLTFLDKQVEDLAPDDFIFARMQPAAAAAMSRVADENFTTTILWQADNSVATLWVMHGAKRLDAASRGPSQKDGWFAKATADFNGDGNLDMLFQKDTGEVNIWLLKADHSKLSSKTVGGNPGPNWHVIGSADFNGDGKADILWQNENGQAEIWLMDGFTQLAGSDIGRNLGPAWHVVGTADFNGDGKDDILWQNDSGQAAVWTMNGLVQTGGSEIGNPGPAWHVKGAADFDGDGKTDILWQNDNGQAAIWLMDGMKQIGASNAGDNLGPSWHVIGGGDFDGDGLADILWQNDNGQAAIWTMDGIHQLGSSTFEKSLSATSHIIGIASVKAPKVQNGENGNLAGNVSQPEPMQPPAAPAATNRVPDDNFTTKIIWQEDNSKAALWVMHGAKRVDTVSRGPLPQDGWHAKAAADFNGDGDADMLFQNDSGEVQIWLFKNLDKLSSKVIGSNSGPGWHVIGTGDFNGDGKADILWQNENGKAAIWLMDGLTQIGNAEVGNNPGASWHVIGAGDFNGDGKDDILWQNDDGQAASWTMNGLTQLSSSAVGSNPGSTWHVKGAADFNGDGKDDILWQNNNGQAAIWLMDGTRQIVASNVGGNLGPSWHVIGGGDFDGDGLADILWQNDNGQAAVWTMDGTHQLGSNFFDKALPATSHIIGIAR